MIKKGDKLICEYIGGGGTEYYDGTYEVIGNTEKTFRLKIIDEGFYNGFLVFIKNKEKIIINKKIFSTRIKDGVEQYKRNKIGIDKEHWLEKGFYLYPNMCGTPYVFKKIKN